jgi:predicted DNA repair protein MutK
MASGIFAILDDIAALMDDVSVAAKVATQKTAGILGDDLAVNAEKATGFLSSRELPVLWAITKGSLLNKAIIIPIIFLLNILSNKIIIGILLIGGCYLAYEGVEKIVEFLFHKKEAKDETSTDVEQTVEESIIVEKKKVKSAIVTDFILSLEIVIIALSTVLGKPTSVQILTVTIVAILATIGVYGFVALIVRMDDAGFKLIKRSNNKGILTTIGNVLVKALPVIVKILSFVGTIALLMVSGGIFDHYIPFAHSFLPSIPEWIKEPLMALIVGLAIVLILIPVKKLFHK